MKPIVPTRQHIWLGNITGLIISYSERFTAIKIKEERYKYMGYTDSVGYPKVMNTGRVLHEITNKKVRCKKRYNYETALISKQLTPES